MHGLGLDMVGIVLIGLSIALYIFAVGRKRTRLGSLTNPTAIQASAFFSTIMLAVGIAFLWSGLSEI
jgi:multisubunit Na+/H+ antiporter MnhB subunit